MTSYTFAIGQSWNELELYRKVFGHDPTYAYDKPLEMDLLVEQERVGEIQVKLEQNIAASSLDAETLFATLEPILLPELLAEIKRSKRQGANNRSFVAVSTLQKVGIICNIDTAGFKVNISIPSKLQKIRDLSLTKRDVEQYAYPEIPQATFSSYLNARAADTYITKTNQVIERRRQPIAANFDSATNFHSYVLEFNGSFTERDPKTEWRIGDIRGVKDLPNRSMRVIVGDLQYETRDYQSFQSLGGVTLSNNFTVGGIRNTSPSGNSAFVLNTPSEVEVFINGQSVYKKKLAAGRYNVQDFPFSGGANDVQVKITDSVGKIETISFPFFYNYQLLAKGLHDFSYTIGMPSTNVDNRKRYNAKQFTTSLFHRIGLTDSFTGGFNFQANEYQYLVGLDSLWEMRYGSIISELSRSDIKHNTSGYAGNVEYIKSWKSQAIGLKYAVKSPKFASLGSLEPAHNLDRHELAARYSFPLPWEIYGSLSASLNYNSGFDERTHSHRLSLNKRLLPGLSSKLSIINKKVLGERSRYEYTASISYNLLNSRSSFNLDYDSETENTTLEWDYSPTAPVYSIGANARVEKSHKDTDKVEGTANYNTNRLETALSYNTISNHDQFDFYDQKANLKLGTALAYANGHFGMTRPIGDSFAMIATTKKLKGRTIDVEPIGDSVFESQANGFGPAIVPSVSSYNPRAISIDDTDFPPGQVLEGNTYLVKASYKSGAVLEIGSDATILIQGRLVDKDGQPIPKMTIALVPKDQPDKEVPEEDLFFTGKRGFFAKQGVAPGEYILLLYNLAKTKIPVTIKENSDEVVDLGTLVAPKKNDSN